jgi:hypothetical protein
MIVERYAPVSLFELVPKLVADFEPELRELDRLLDGQPRYKQPLWLMVVGQLTWTAASTLYRPRWREETWHRQAKDPFGWSRAQLGDVAWQDRWSWVVLLAC